MPRAAHPHPLGLEDKPLAFRIHNIEGGLFVVKAIWKGVVQGVIDIFHIKGGYLLPILYNGRFYGVGPGAHMVDIGLGNRQPCHRSTRRKIQPSLGKHFPGVGYPFALSRHNQR